MGGFDFRCADAARGPLEKPKNRREQARDINFTH
jgi:hypothetical protein